MKDVDDILNHIVQIENGFVHINDGATAILEAYSQAQICRLLYLSTRRIKLECCQQLC